MYYSHKNEYPTGTYENKKMISITRNDEIHIKFDCSNESMVNCSKRPNIFSFALVAGLRQRFKKRPKI